MEVYLKTAFEELFQDDGLVVFGRGLGLRNLFAKFVQFYCRQQESCKRLIFFINAHDYIDYVRNALITNDPNLNSLLFPKVITNEISTMDRNEMYREGGCFFVTSRTLIVDLLDGKLDPNIVGGLLIANAHRISETSIESFVIRVFRDKNREGFIKAFSDEPEALVHGFGKIERLLKVLYVKKLYLYPRFQLTVANALDKNQPEVIELAQSITEKMKAIQSAILVSMNSCLTELKKAVPQLDTTNMMSLENGLFKSFDYSIRTQLDPDWHKLSPRTKQLVSDMTELRKLFDYLLRYDAYTFYSFLLSLRSASIAQPFPSLWLTSQAADLMFRKAKDRVYTITAIPSASDSIANIPKELTAVRECLPKWSLLLSIVDEVKKHYEEETQKQQQSKDLPSSVSSPSTKQLQQSLSSSSSSSSSLPSSKFIPGRVMVFVKDERTAIHIRDVLSFGTEFVMDQRHRWFVSQQAADIRIKGGNNSSSTSIKNNSNSNTNSNSTSNNNNNKRFSSNSAPSISSSSSSSPSNNNKNTTTTLPSIPNQRADNNLDTNTHTDNSNFSISDNSNNNYLGMSISKKTFDGLSEENKLILLHELKLRQTPIICPRNINSSSNDNNSSNYMDLVSNDIDDDNDNEDSSDVEADVQGDDDKTDDDENNTAGNNIEGNHSAKKRKKSTAATTSTTANKRKTNVTAKIKLSSSAQKKKQRDFSHDATNKGIFLDRNENSNNNNNSKTLSKYNNYNAPSSSNVNVYEIMKQTEARYDTNAVDYYTSLGISHSSNSNSSSNIAVRTIDTELVTGHRHAVLRHHLKRHEKISSVDHTVLKESKKDNIDEEDSDDSDGSDSDTSSSSSTASDDSDDSSNSSLAKKSKMEKKNDSSKATTTTASSATIASSFHVVVTTHTEAQNRYEILSEMSPAYVILYDVDLELVRSLETYQSMRSSSSLLSTLSSSVAGATTTCTTIPALKVYLFMYEESVEEHRYMSILGKEKRAFEQLILAKEIMLISLPDAVADVEKERMADRELSGDSRRSSVSSSHNSSALSGTLVAGSSSTSTSNRVMKVVVDVRDFRSALPSLLYAGGFTVIPRTLTVGDFVLSSEICIERKGISDLFQSLASGRLYHQAEGMSRYYKYPCLLIEFTLDRAFTLQGSYEISSDSIQASSVITRICQLVLAFPSLRLLWSRSPHNTVTIFQSIMQRNDEVDVNKAVLAGSDGSMTLALTQGGSSNKSNNNNADHHHQQSIEVEEASSRLTAQEMLLSLPGININNCRAVMNHVESIAHLSCMEIDQLTPLIGPINAMKLHSFFRQRS